MPPLLQQTPARRLQLKLLEAMLVLLLPRRQGKSPPAKSFSPLFKQKKRGTALRLLLRLTIGGHGQHRHLQQHRCPLMRKAQPPMQQRNKSKSQSMHPTKKQKVPVRPLRPSPQMLAARLMRR